MISRCPRCGVPVPDTVRQCPSCGRDFVNNKKGIKKPDEPKKAEPPPDAGFSLPPARGGVAPRKPPAETGGAPAPADENSFALPVARNLGPKPGESLFAPPPPKEAPVPKPAEVRKVEPPPKPSPVPEPDPEPVPDDPEENSAALFLPSSTKEIVVESAKRPEPTEPAAASTGTKVAGRQSAAYLAALAGGALGLLSVCVIYVMMRAEPQAAARPTGSSPFGKRSSSDAGLAPNLDEPELPPQPPASPPPTSIPAPVLSRAVEPPAPRSTAVFVTVAKPKAPAVAKAPKPAVVAAPKKPKGPQWVFEGEVYDLLSTRGAYGVRLVFVDADDNEVASVETAEDGRYRAAMKPGPAEGYALRIQHDDYSGKHIDELDSTSSVRKAELEQRKFLMQAGARSLPWIGQTGKPIRRDMALVPKTFEE